MWLHSSYLYWLPVLSYLSRFSIHSLLLPSQLFPAPIIHPVPSFLPRPGFSVVLNQTQFPWPTSRFSQFSFTPFSHASSCQLAFDQSLCLRRLGAGGGGVCKTAEDTPGSCFQFRHLELHQLPCLEKQDWQKYNVLIEDRIPWHFLSNTIVKVDLQFKFGQQK